MKSLSFRCNLTENLPLLKPIEKPKINALNSSVFSLLVLLYQGTFHDNHFQVANIHSVYKGLHLINSHQEC